MLLFHVWHVWHMAGQARIFSDHLMSWPGFEPPSVQFRQPGTFVRTPFKLIFRDRHQKSTRRALSPSKISLNLQLTSLFRYWYKLASCCIELVQQSVKKYSWFEICSERGKQFKETKEGEIICNKTRGPFILTTFWQPGTRQQQKQQHQLLLQK